MIEPKQQTLELLNASFDVVRLEPDMDITAWATNGPLASITRTSEELSILCLDASVPKSVKAERGFRCFQVQGPLDFTEVGVLASLAQPLAEAGVSIFVLSTFDTDYLLVRGSDLPLAQDALVEAGHSVEAV
ncbi:MAG: ACT domain-containing protein [Anaerolineales bacterium]